VTVPSDPSGVFGEAGPYAYKKPAIRANSRHPDQPGGVQGKECLACHSGNGRAPKFNFAGTIYRGEGPRDANGAPTIREKPASTAHIRIITNDGWAFDVFADEDGNFWSKSNGKTYDFSRAFSGARSARFRAFGRLNGNSCYSCHDTGGNDPGRLWILE
jgi:hypothetical protein